MRQLPRSSVFLILIIASVATVLSVISYQYSTLAANQILGLASQEVRSTTNVQADGLASVLANKVETVSSNLQVLTETRAVQYQDIQNAEPHFTSARKSTGDFASSYFWVDSDGKLLWADSFTNKTLEQQYNGGDRSNRDYYLKPRETLLPYYTAVIESIDGVPRMYIGYPIIGGDDAETFKGVIAAAINLDTLGMFLKGQLQSTNSSSTGLLDTNGLVLYSSGSPELVGVNIFDPEIQNRIPADVKGPFNQFIRDSLTGKSGIGELTSQGTTSTIAYRSVTVQGNGFAVLYVVTPHQLAGNVIALVEQQRTLNTAIIIAIAAIGAGTAALVLTWNKRLTKVVTAKTSELKVTNESLVESNRRLHSANANLEDANRQLAEANEQLLLHDKMQKEFINVAAHELRTPTQAILGYSELIHQDDADDLRAAKEAIFRNANRLHKLTDDILDVTRIEGQALKIEKEEFDMNQKIEQVIEDTKNSMLNGSRTNIIFKRTEPELLVYADKARIFQVISNLLNNALKFAKDGTVVIKAEKVGQEAFVDVTDNGTGIHPDIMPRLFTKFATKSESGTGLGLYISKNIVEAHGGKIWAKNNESGKGSTFIFSLPSSAE